MANDETITPEDLCELQAKMDAALAETAKFDAPATLELARVFKALVRVLRTERAEVERLKKRIDEVESQLVEQCIEHGTEVERLKAECRVNWDLCLEQRTRAEAAEGALKQKDIQFGNACVEIQRLRAEVAQYTPCNSFSQVKDFYEAGEE